MSKKLIFVMLLALCMLFQGGDLWADDDAIMDVDDNAATLSGSWINSKYRILYYGDDYEYARGAGSGSGATAVATFQTAQYADITGNYHVYVRWTAGTARDTSAVYRVYDGSTYLGYCTKDQRYNGGAWQFCREVTLTAGKKGKVTLTNENTPTSRYTCADAVRFVRVEKDKYDIVDEAGYELSQRGSIAASGLASCSLPSVNWTTLATVTLSTPRSYGLVWVHANGISKHINDGTARVCIARAGGNCASWAPVLDQSSTEVIQGAYDNETRWVVSDTFPASGTSQTFLLKGCKGAVTANVELMWDDFVGLYFPQNY